MKQGRPFGSEIRQNIVELLHYMGEGYAYKIYKAYISIFPKISMRSVYYHLKKGSDIGEFEIKSIRSEQGDYSWGDRAERIIYKLGPRAIAQGNKKIKEFFDKKGN